MGSLADAVCLIALQPQLVAQPNAPSSGSTGWFVARGSFDGCGLCGPAEMAGLAVRASVGLASTFVSVRCKALDS